MSFTLNHTDLQTLDPKCRINFGFKSNNEVQPFTNGQKYGSSVIWEIDDFLTETECSIIIDKCQQQGFIDCQDRQRLLVFSDDLQQLVQERLNQDHFIQRLNHHKWAKPYGFDDLTWDKKNTSMINPCFRITKFTKNGFPWHRDAQFTQGTIRSNYTLIVYLNQDKYETQSSGTVFLESKGPFNGVTINGELKFNKDVPTITIERKRGKAVIFDQRLIHCGKISGSDKYVLRTELLVEGTPTMSVEGTPVEGTPTIQSKIKQLAQKLFRQAQYIELEGGDANNLYQIVLSLRQNPSSIKTYPKHLESFLKLDIQNKFGTNIDFIGRSGHRYRFKVKTNILHPDAVKLASIFLLVTETNRISNDAMEKVEKYVSLLNSTVEHHQLDESPKDSSEDSSSDESDHFEQWDYSRDPRNSKDFELFELDNRQNKLSTIPEYCDLVIENSIDKKKNGKGVIVVGQQHSLYMRCEGCSLCDDDCFGSGECPGHHHQGIEFTRFELDLTGSYFHIEPKTKNTGIVTIESAGQSFNHASCQCEKVIGKRESETVYTTITFKIKYKFNGKRLTLSFTPKVVM